MTISERPCHLVPRYSRQSSFRNYSLEAFSAGEIRIELHRPGSGPFAQMHGRIKRSYILEQAQPSAIAK
jgi:hypothetical protein